MQCNAMIKKFYTINYEPIPLHNTNGKHGIFLYVHEAYRTSKLNFRFPFLEMEISVLSWASEGLS
jgi:hypothetical protein